MPQTAASRILLLGTEATSAAGVFAVTGVTTGTSQAIHRNTDSVLSFYLRSIGTTSGGTILIEEADFSDQERDFSGTWSQIASIAASSFTGGAQVAYHITDCSYGYVRVRISAAITGGGSITAVLRSRGAA